MLSRRSLLRINNTLNILSKSSSTTSSPAVTKHNTVKQSEVTLQQAPNFPTTWSTSQHPRPGPHYGPRFEQTDMSLQPNPLSAMELVAQEPIRLVKGRRAVCDGGSFCPCFRESSHIFFFLMQNICFSFSWKFFRSWSAWSP